MWESCFHSSHTASILSFFLYCLTNISLAAYKQILAYYFFISVYFIFLSWCSDSWKWLDPTSPVLNFSVYFLSVCHTVKVFGVRNKIWGVFLSWWWNVFGDFLCVDIFLFQHLNNSYNFSQPWHFFHLGLKFFETYWLDRDLTLNSILEEFSVIYFL